MTKETSAEFVDKLLLYVRTDNFEAFCFALNRGMYFYGQNKLSYLLHKDLMNKIRTADDKEEVIYDNIEKESEAATYTILDMNDGAPIVLPLSVNNIENISRSFESWRDTKLQRILDPDARNNFDFATNHLMSQKGTSVVEVKMMLMNMDIINSGDFDAIFKSQNFKQQGRDNLNKL